MCAGGSGQAFFRENDYTYYPNIYILVPITGTIMESKEENVLRLFFDEPSKQWHFEEIVSSADIVRSKAYGWLKKLAKSGIIKRVKPKGKMPYYIGNYLFPEYQNRKKIFAIKMLHDSGLLNHLASLEKAKTIIIFGSFARWDWYKESDIDLFIYGDDSDFEIGKYQLKLNREIQLFTCKDKKDLEKLGTGLISNIIKGNIIKGELDFIKVDINA